MNTRRHFTVRRAMNVALLLSIGCVSVLGFISGSAGASPPTSVTITDGSFNINIGDNIFVTADIDGTYALSGSTNDCNTGMATFTTNNVYAPTVYVPAGDLCFDYDASVFPTWDDFYVADGGTASTDTYVPLASTFSGCTLEGLTGASGLVDFVGSPGNPYVASSTNMSTPSIVNTPNASCSSSNETTLASQMGNGVTGSGSADL